MEMMRLMEVAQVLNAQVHGSDVRFNDVKTDSRSIKRGDLFVALAGERYDGHKFIPDAQRGGAVAAMINDRALESIPINIPSVLVRDTRKAYGKLASHWRSRFDIPIVALTGSSGKTTVKEMLAAILREANEGTDSIEVLATEGNLNNDIGVPHMLFRLRPIHRYAVIEMGMNHKGEISYLSNLTQPAVAIINNAGSAHLEGLGSLEAIARAKGEIIEGLRLNGTVVLNRDDKFFSLWRDLSGERRIVDFGMDGTAAVSAKAEFGVEGSKISLHTPTGGAVISLRVPGQHNVYNALAAAAGAVALSISIDAISRGLASYRGVKGRLEFKHGLDGANLIDDTYNANPESVYAALQVLAKFPTKKILVLGDMGELGPGAWDFHSEIGLAAKQAGIDTLFTFGDLSAAAKSAFGDGAMHFERIQELLAQIENLLSPNVTLLVKGSRFMQMERVVKAFSLDEELREEIGKDVYVH